MKDNEESLQELETKGSVVPRQEFLVYRPMQYFVRELETDGSIVPQYELPVCRQVKYFVGEFKT